MPVNSVTSSNVRWYDGDPTGDGCGLGKTTSSKVGFYGTTPAVQPTSASQGAVTATAVTAVNTTATITTAAHGFTTGTFGDAVVKRVSQMQVDVAAAIVLANQLRSELIALGLISGAA